MRKLIVLLVLAACGDDGVRHLKDAAMPDVVTPDGPPAPVTVTVLTGNAPNPGVVVYFQNADNSLVKTAMTDANGQASALMASGGYVTALNPYVQPPAGIASEAVVTIAGVKGGDNLRITDNGGAPVGMTFDVVLPNDSNPNVDHYNVTTNCGSTIIAVPGIGSGGPTNPTGTLTLYGCGTTLDMLVLSEDSNYSAVNAFYIPDQPIVTGTLDLRTKTFAAVPDTTFTYTNLGSVTAVNVQDTTASGKGRVYDSYIFGSSGGNTIMASVAVPTFANATHVIQSRFGNTGNGRQTFLDWGPYNAAYSTDVSARALPNFADYPSVDAAAHKVTWTEGTAAAKADFVVASVQVQRPTPFKAWIWNIAAPYGTTSVTLPTLPTEVYDYNIATTDNAQVDALVTAKVTPGGYDAVRNNIVSLSGPEEIAFGPTGTATFQQAELILNRAAPPTAPRLWTPRPTRTRR